MVGCHHRLDGHGFGWTPGVGDGQEGLACCGPWGVRVLVKALFRAVGGQFLAVSSHTVRGQGGLWVSFLNFVYLYIFLVTLHGMWDLSSLTRDQTGASCIGNSGVSFFDTKFIQIY